MSNIEKAAQVILNSKAFRAAVAFGIPDGADAEFAGYLAKALADAGLIVTEPCICDSSPLTDGPAETCPQHGRPYSDWAERCGELQESLNASSENTRTEWGVEYTLPDSVTYISKYAETEQQARELVAGSKYPARAVSREVTEWEVAP